MERERKEIEVEVQGVTKLVSIARYPGLCWYLDSQDKRHHGVVFRFKTGKKRHVLLSPQVFLQGDTARITTDVIHNRRVFAVKWATEQDHAQRSEWTGGPKQ